MPLTSMFKCLTRLSHEIIALVTNGRAIIRYSMKLAGHDVYLDKCPVVHLSRDNVPVTIVLHCV